jgi:hypothetical protein
MTQRLVFFYEGDNVRLVSRQRVVMKVPPSDPPTLKGDQAGFWVEVRDSEERVLYRRVMPNPIASGVEVRSDDPERPLSWRELKEPRGSFTLLVPDIGATSSLVLLGSPGGRGAPTGPAKEIARFDLSVGGDEKEQA